jgi:hypothetical protein
MKNFIIVTVLLLGLASCTKESPLSEASKELSVTSSQQKWVLIKMTGSFSQVITVGSSMAWQEYYLFNEDGTFTKNRIQDNSEKTSSGTYERIVDNGQEYLELTFTTGKELVASCYGTAKEKLWRSSVNRIQGTWNHCDGPTLEYARPSDQ